MLQLQSTSSRTAVKNAKYTFPPPWPSFTEEEADAVREVVLSNRVNYWTGDRTREFECDFAGFAGTDYAIALANGTVALDVALQALGVKQGDEVVVTPRTIIASISTVVTAGARPVFAEVDRDTQNISAETILPVLTPATRVIIVVHLAGMPADMDPKTSIWNRLQFTKIT